MKENERKMFQKMKNIDTAFRYIRLVSVVFITGTLLLCVFVIAKSYQASLQSQQRVFILANGKAIEAFAAERKENIPVEARDHVKMFHHYFFSLDPDEKVIQEHITKALYLADRSAKEQYDNLKENGYFASVISGNISQEIEADSIAVNMDQYPFYFRYTGKQRIIRPASIVTRLLITEGYLRSVARSDHNPHGFLIEKWRTVSNQDLQSQNR